MSHVALSRTFACRRVFGLAVSTNLQKVNARQLRSFRGSVPRAGGPSLRGLSTQQTKAAQLSRNSELSLKRSDGWQARLSTGGARPEPAREHLKKEEKEWNEHKPKIDYKTTQLIHDYGL